MTAEGPTRPGMRGGDIGLRAQRGGEDAGTQVTEPLRPPALPSHPLPTAGGAGRGAGRPARRVAFIALLVVTLLASLGAGGVFAAQRIASGLPHPREARLASLPRVVTLVKPATGKQAHPPVALANCACSPAREVIPAPVGGVPNVAGQLVLVSVSQQWLWAYDNGALVMATPVTTGQPALPTPPGVYHIMMKESSIWFYSPWPQGSPYYYTPEYIDYAMLFRAGGFYLHTAEWRHVFGPGTNVSHTNPDGTTETGSHGCVNMPLDASGVLYNWIQVGTTVDITD